MTAKVDNTTGAVAFVWAYFKPLIFGANIALVSGIVFFPVSAIFVLEKHVLTVMCRVLKVLDITTKAFLLRDSSAILTPQQFSSHMAEVRQAMSALKEATLEAKYEISYSNHKPEDFDAIQKTLLLISQHLGSMTLSAQNERYLTNARDYLDQRQPPSGTHPYTPVGTVPISISRPSASQSELGPPSPLAMSLRTTQSLDQPVLACLNHCVPKELAKADRKIFMQLLHSFGPSIQELSYLCELTLDRCVHRFIKNCEGLTQSSVTVRIVNELPDDLLIHNYSVIEARMDVPENPAVPGGEKAAETTSGGEGSPTSAPAPNPTHPGLRDDQIPHPVRSNDPLSDADMQEFVNKIQRAIARFDKLEVTAIRKVYRHTMNVVDPTGPRESHREPGVYAKWPSFFPP
ncbi:hypothetical protein BJ085DRAFT_32636 [Dimargaris cristalligena]|uniref:Putative ER transporter 6TM N-terminal domain-containing protein n=1 Tax=Dimargaris cristalligena TaxID=215637 RepID=A0A4P9ZK94_9FUNG|nr:hypothetical protein BJ085DRAFT_32636 [Dimargaris cristalligena]|eukprot:RKP33503.1 hypothetical protein BJ085DRAFT_32636 [Dimargaris cristalligena]